MAGILDSKRRILDALLTVDGRRQMAANTIDISFATFSDEGLFYDSEDGRSARDISDLPILEVASLPRDVIIPEVDDDGAFSLNLSDGNKIVNGRKVISGALDTISVDGNGVRTVTKVESVLTGTINVYSASLDVISTAKNHFDQLNLIRTDDGLLDSLFKVDTNTIKLTTSPIETALSAIRPLVFDDCLSHTINTRFLPPEVTTDENKSIPLGDYPKLNKQPYNNFDAFEDGELMDSISSREVNFTNTGKSNNLLCQMFEINADTVTKLTVVDYGEFVDAKENVKRVFFLVKPIRDSNGAPKLCKLFTLVFEK
jgi:hypothetical protein